MLTGIKTELINRINEITSYAQRGDEFFADELCNFIANEFEIHAIVIFSVNEAGKSVIGKSHQAKKNFQNGSVFQCQDCILQKTKNYSSLHFDPTCSIQISDSTMNEGCSYVKTFDNHVYLFKFAKKTPFSQAEKEALQKILHFGGMLLSVWVANRGGSLTSLIPFTKLVGDATQELKSSINSIIGFSSILAEEFTSGTHADYLTLIKKNAQNLLLNANDLNEIAKSESGTLVTTKKNVSINSLIKEIVQLFQSKLTNKNITINFHFVKELDKPIEIDDQKLRYVITNILFLSSSLTENGQVDIRVVPEGDKKIKFTISDSGKGFEDEVLNKLFEPYAISKVPEFKNSSISGLSLALLKRYINFLGGDISVVKNLDTGLSFTFTIHGEVMSEIEATLSQLPKPTSKNKVLVIEDDYATSKLLNNYLNKWGYDPVIVNTEEQVFKIIESQPLLAVILDIEIPSTNGLELLKKIHEHPNTKNVPVIVCSIEPEQQKAFMMGAVEYFIKPINYNYLVEVLTSYKLRKDSNILCVDDDIPTLNLIKQAIESAGFNAVAESVSANVMGLIKEKDIDLAIVDLDMPHPNGFELIKMIKSEKKFAHLPIIIYTGKENYKDDLGKIEGLFEELLDKRSTNIEDLADTINTMINWYEVPPPVEEVIHKKGGIKILLAEDYKHSQIIVTRLLKKNNFEEIVVVENGEDAVKMSRDQHFDLILMDMQMPIMNGFEATEKIRQMPDYKSVPIIALTAFAMKGDREKCLEAGATDYIPKPIDSKEFIEKVKYYTNA